MTRFIQNPTLTTLRDPARGTIAAPARKAIAAHQARLVLTKMASARDLLRPLERALRRKWSDNRVRRLASASDATRRRYAPFEVRRA
jgi:hypothetical protein